MQSRVARLILAVIVACCTGVALAGSASAHASLKQTTPRADQVVTEPPSQITLEFSAPVDAGFGGVTVLGPTGGRADIGVVNTLNDSATLVVPVDATESGTYTVSWRVTSQDGHTIDGAFVVHVREKSASATGAARPLTFVTILALIGRWMAYIAAFLCVGLGVASLCGASLATWPRAAWIALGWVLVVGMVVVLVTRVAQASGQGIIDALDLVSRFVRHNRSGTLDALRVALAIGAAVVCSFRRFRAYGLALVGIAILVTYSLSGHAWTSAHRGYAVAVDMVHVTSSAIWLGGLMVLTMTRLDRAVLTKFSAVATAALIATLLSAATSTMTHVDAWAGLAETRYGQVLRAKAVVVAIVAALGWVNRRNIEHHLERAISGVRREAVVGLAVLLLTSMIVAEPPATESLYVPFDERTSTTSGVTQLSIEPTRVGPNELHVTFTTSAGTQRPVDAAEVSIAGPGVEKRVVPTKISSADHLVASEVVFGARGVWTITISQVTGDQTDIATFEVKIR